MTSSAVWWELQYTEGTSNKFYQVAITGREMVTAWGRIGGTPQFKVYNGYASVREVVEAAVRVSLQKSRKGYELSVTPTPFEVRKEWIESLLRASDRESFTFLQAAMEHAEGMKRTRRASPTVLRVADLHKAAFTHLTEPAATPRPSSRAAKTTPPISLGRVGPTARPNGTLYYPRELCGHEDITVLRAAKRLRQAAVLAGPPGTGKTALVEAAFPEAKQLVGTSETEVTDLVGSWISKGAAWVWQPGPLQLSLQEDVPLYVDEIALIDPKVLPVMYPLLDGRAEISISANPELPPLKRGPGWMLIASYNPDVPGANMSEAMLDRFDLRIEVPTDYELARQLGVPSDMVGIAMNLDRKRIAGEIGWAPQMRTLLTFADNVKHYGVDFAVDNMISAVPREDLDVVMDAIKTKYSKPRTLRLGERTL